MLNLIRPAALRLVFALDSPSARAVSSAVRGFLAEQGVPEKELYSYQLCVAEASYNAVEYAAGANRGIKPVAEALFTPTQVELRVTDHTGGFFLPEIIPPPSPLKERGRGLFLIKAVMDEVRYLRSPQENTLVMRKKRAAVHPAMPAQAKGFPTGSTESEGERSFPAETLSAVFRSCAELGRGEESAERFGERLLTDLLHLTSSDWYVLRMLAPDNRHLVATTASAPELASGPIVLPAAGETPHGLEATAAASRTSARFEIRETDEFAEPLRCAGTDANGIVCPLCFGGTLVGTLAIGRRDGGFLPGKLQEEVVRTFAEFLAIQTINLRRRKEEVQSRVVARELEIAQEIQHLLLPRTLPQVVGFGLVGGWQSAREVGGDFYDAISLGGRSLLLMIADVMGKGVPAALFATTMRGLMRGLAARSDDPAQLLGGMNRLLHKELSAVNMFIAAQIAVVDLQTRRITAASAGHCPLLYVAPGYRTVSALPTQGVPIGVLPDTVYRNVTGTLGAPATLLLHTDGLTDIRNPAGEMFGQRRLMEWMRANAIQGRTSNELRDRLTAELARFRGEAALVDDQAFLLLAEEFVGAAPADGTGQRRIRFKRGSFLFPANA
jgi:serine phosphatase RsbU (regulator of sigma subunit)/anti-sigma regulatory factor (Ser/Thr protein kinase)